MFSKLKGKTILITGGTGYFGKVLTEHLCKINVDHSLDLRIILSARNPVKLTGIEFVKSDIRKPLKVDGNIDFIIHAATPVANDKSESSDLLDIIINGTQKILNLALEKKSSKIINISSGSIYGAQPQNIEFLPESFSKDVSLFNSSNIYGSGKLIAENIVQNFCRNNNINYLTLRCFAFSGKYLPLDAQFAIGNFVRDAKTSGIIKIKGDGSAIRSYLDSSDMADWVTTALMSSISGKTYNVGSEHAISILDLAHLVASLVPGTKVEIENSLSREIKTNRYIPSVAKIMNELKVTQKVSLKQSIENMINFERDQ